MLDCCLTTWGRTGAARSEIERAELNRDIDRAELRRERDEGPEIERAELPNRPDVHVSYRAVLRGWAF
jgi:hypothetical protein